MAVLRHLPTVAGMDASIKTRASLLALSLLSFSACDAGGDEGPVDGRDDAFLGSGKADGAISEGSDEARAVLALVNTASFEVLDDSDEVGLDVRAARTTSQAETRYRRTHITGLIRPEGSPEQLSRQPQGSSDG